MTTLSQSLSRRTKTGQSSTKASNNDGSNKRDQVLTKAIINLADFLALERKDLKEILGASEPSLARTYSHKRLIVASSKEGQLALLLVRVYRSLFAMLGGEREACRKWLRSKNRYFDQTPIEAMKSVQGLSEVALYLDAMRGQY